MNKITPFAAVIVIFAAALTLLLVFGNNQEEPSPQENTPASQKAENIEIEDGMLKNALNLYIQKKEEGVDFSEGPCLGSIGPGWVLDIAHNPRQAVDNEEENQCRQYLTGEAEHFIEMDPEGNLIRTK